MSVEKSNFRDWYDAPRLGPGSSIHMTASFPTHQERKPYNPDMLEESLIEFLRERRLSQQKGHRRLILPYRRIHRYP